MNLWAFTACQFSFSSMTLLSMCDLFFSCSISSLYKNEWKVRDEMLVEKQGSDKFDMIVICAQAENCQYQLGYHRTWFVSPQNEMLKVKHVLEKARIYFVENSD